MPIDDYDRIIAEESIAVEWFAHPPVGSVEEARTHWAAIDAAHTKNLLLKDEGRRFWLVVLPAEARIDLKTLPSAIGSRRLRFAPAEDLQRLLGVTSGAVSPLALVNDGDRQVTLAITSDLLNADKLAFHPLRNDATVTITPAEFGRYLLKIGYEPILFMIP